MEIDKINMEDAPMQFSPKLKAAKTEIMEVLKKHDIAGMFVLHTPGHGEFMLHVDTGYSCAKFNGNELRVRAKLQEDFGGDKKKWEQKIGDTVNMLQTFHECGGMLNDNIANMIEVVAEKVIIEDTGTGGMTTHETQMN